MKKFYSHCISTVQVNGKQMNVISRDISSIPSIINKPATNIKILPYVSLIDFYSVTLDNIKYRSLLKQEHNTIYGNPPLITFEQLLNNIRRIIGRKEI